MPIITTLAAGATLFSIFSSVVSSSVRLKQTVGRLEKTPDGELIVNPIEDSSDLQTALLGGSLAEVCGQAAFSIAFRRIFRPHNPPLPGPPEQTEQLIQLEQMRLLYYKLIGQNAQTLKELFQQYYHISEDSLKRTSQEILDYMARMDQKLDILLQADFEAGVRNMQYADEAQKPEKFLKNAIALLIRALSQEKNERCVMAHVCLSMCLFRDGEIDLGWQNLEKIAFIPWTEEPQRRSSDRFNQLKFEIETYRDHLLCIPGNVVVYNVEDLLEALAGNCRNVFLKPGIYTFNTSVEINREVSLIGCADINGKLPQLVFEGDTGMTIALYDGSMTIKKLNLCGTHDNTITVKAHASLKLLESTVSNSDQNGIEVQKQGVLFMQDSCVNSCNSAGVAILGRTEIRMCTLEKNYNGIIVYMGGAGIVDDSCIRDNSNADAIVNNHGQLEMNHCRCTQSRSGIEISILGQGRFTNVLSDNHEVCDWNNQSNNVEIITE